MAQQQAPPPHILPLIVFAQFAGTSLWFAGNAVVESLQQSLELGPGTLGAITSAVQLGFIVGTLVFAFLSVADRFSPTRVFLLSALAGAFFNLAVTLFADGLAVLLALRFLTGFFLAGIYPVGMKISSDWYAEGLGKALGYLVGALVVGTAFPHLLREYSQGLPWKAVLWGTSLVAAAGGLLLFLFVPDGPHRRRSPRFEWDAIPRIFKFKDFRHAAFGYFGHMWELYAFWAFIPVILSAYALEHQAPALRIALWSFLIIGIGGLGCIAGGYISLRRSSARVAYWMIAVSGLCCLLSPLLFTLPLWLFLSFLLLWGFAVVGDSPQFSTVIAQAAPRHFIGTALTIVNSIGFAVTIGSIQLLSTLRYHLPNEYLLLFLLPGPLFGLWSLRKLLVR